MNFFAKHRKTPETAAVCSALLAGYLTHQFALVNVIHNIDDIGNVPFGYGVGLPLGRWLLTALGDALDVVGGGVNLPFANGLAFLVLVALSAGFLVTVFQIRSKVSAALMGALMAVFPTVATTLTYRFTSVYYGLALLLAVMATWAMGRYKYGMVFSALLVALSMGLYQAYVSVTIGIFILALIQQGLKSGDIKTVVYQGLKDCGALLLGLGMYFLGLKLCLTLYGDSLSAYDGVSTMGQISLAELPGLVWNSFRNFCKFPLTNYCDLAYSKILKMAYFLLGGVSVGMIFWLMVTRVKKVVACLGIGMLCLLFPIGVNFVPIMAPEAWMYTMMAYSFVLVGCVPLVLWECFPEEKHNIRLPRWGNRMAAILVAVLILSYGYETNIHYTKNYYINRQAENYIASLVTQVRMTEGFTPEKKWAMIGQISDPLLDTLWEYEPSFGGLFLTERTLNDISQYYWFWNYVGYRIPQASPEEIQALQAKEAVKAMPCWPSEGSIQVIEDTVVIKFQELS